VAEKVEQAPEYEGQEEHKGNPTRSDPSRVQARDEALAEVRRIREENDARARAHSRTEVPFEVSAVSPAGNEDVKPISGQTADGRLYLNTHGEKVLDQDGIADLQRKLAQAFQAVS
jgi:hypothetical protein